MSANNSKPTAAAPVVVLREEQSDFGRYMLRLVPACIASLVVHVALAALFWLFTLNLGAGETKKEIAPESNTINAEKPVDEKMASFTTVDENPASTEKDQDINYMNDRIAEISVPGSVNPNEAIGFKDGARDAPPVTLPPPGGFGSRGQGGALESFSMTPGNSNAVGETGGYGPRGLPLDKNFEGRSGATREYALREGGGTDKSEAAVTAGLRWLIRQQMPEGKWMLNGPTLADRDRGSDSNDTAATAFGLLPFLAAGKTHKPSKDNAYDKQIDKALKYLMRTQDQKTGFFGGRMYGHGLATIAMCEAYGLSQDPALRRSAQLGLDLIVAAQGDGGGWGYGPQKRAGGYDTSIAGWQIMALKSGQMAGLNVPVIAVKRSIAGLDACCSPNEGYGYSGPADSFRMTAVGLLCRQYMQNWGPSHPRMIKSINHIKRHPPTTRDVYYYYYATQVMHHFGGEDWKTWNDKMRDTLTDKQDKGTSPNNGSWAPQGDAFAGHGGRLMITSLNLLTLEVYYRYLPLYYRDAGYKMDNAVQRAL